LMDLIGELVIAESTVLQNPDLKVPGLELSNFLKAAAQLSKITTELQEAIMSMRMMPLTNTFQKMKRIVFDVSRKLGKDIELEINNGLVSYSYFRWHAAGDIVDERYFDGMVKVAIDLPNTSFLAFTKKFEIVNKYLRSGGVIPENLHIVFSAWGDSFKIKNPYRFPVAYVRFSDDSQNKTIPKEAVECSGNCTKCLQCWKIKKGESVVFNKH